MGTVYRVHNFGEYFDNMNYEATEILEGQDYPEQPLSFVSHRGTWSVLEYGIDITFVREKNRVTEMAIQTHPFNYLEELK